MDFYKNLFIKVEETRGTDSCFNLVADFATESFKRAGEPISVYRKSKRENILSRIEDPVRDLLNIPQNNDLVDVIFVGAVGGRGLIIS